MLCGERCRYIGRQDNGYLLIDPFAILGSSVVVVRDHLTCLGPRKNDNEWLDGVKSDCARENRIKSECDSQTMNEDRREGKERGKERKKASKRIFAFSGVDYHR